MNKYEQARVKQGAQRIENINESQQLSFEHECCPCQPNPVTSICCFLGLCNCERHNTASEPTVIFSFCESEVQCQLCRLAPVSASCIFPCLHVLPGQVAFAPPLSPTSWICYDHIQSISWKLPCGFSKQASIARTVWSRWFQATRMWHAKQTAESKPLADRNVSPRNLGISLHLKLTAAEHCLQI